MVEIKSPNTVLANALDNTLDLLQPRIILSNPKQIEFVVGTQINGKPHIGTYLVLTGAFVMAQKAHQKYGLPVSVKFGALDNAPYDIVKGIDGASYQKTFGHSFGFKELNTLIDFYYVDFMNQLSSTTNVPYVWATYESTQKNPTFRRNFLEVLKNYDQLRWVVSPSHGDMRIRIPCPKCSYSEKYATKTTVLEHDDSHALIRSYCHQHGWYDSHLFANGNDGIYLDLNTLLRNVIKEACCAENEETLSIMVKGGDWVASCSLVDLALGVLGYTANKIPMRIFTPEVVTLTGAKLSKSLIREGDKTLGDIPEWILDMGIFTECFKDDHVQRMVWLLEQFISHPRHMFRAYCYTEIVRLLEHYEEV
jgi:hypothetical protein